MEGNQAADGHTPFMVAGPSAEAVETLAMMDWESFLPASSCRLASLLSGCSFPGLFRILRLKFKSVLTAFTETVSFRIRILGTA